MENGEILNEINKLIEEDKTLREIFVQIIERKRMIDEDITGNRVVDILVAYKDYGADNIQIDYKKRWKNTAIIS